VGMMMRHPELGCSLSDHFAIEATLAFHPFRQSQLSPPVPESNSNTISNRDSTPTATGTHEPIPPTSPEKSTTDSALHNGAYLQLQQSPTPSIAPEPEATYHSQLTSFLSPSPDTLPSTAYETILSLIKSYTAREESQLTWRARHFFAALLVSVACLVGVWFTPSGKNYVSFILMLVSTLGLAAGTVDGLMALLFFRSELKALREFEWEVRNARGILLGGGVQEEDGDRNWDEEAGERGW
jgi:sphingomyelin phosphodiesterase 2